jgi:hypothetical protein
VRGKSTNVWEMIWKEEAQHIDGSADEDEQLHERPARKRATAAAAAAVEARIRDAEDTDKGQAQQRNRAPQGTSGANEQVEGEEGDDDV